MNDLMFLSKIVEAAKALAVPLRSLKTAEKLVAACRENPSTIVFLDLDDQQLDAVSLARSIRGATPAVNATLYAFVSHVNESRIQDAGKDLFDQIFSRGQFTRILPELLAPSQPSPS